MDRKTFIIETSPRGTCVVWEYEGHVQRDIEKAIDLEEEFECVQNDLTPEEVCDLLKS